MSHALIFWYLLFNCIQFNWYEISVSTWRIFLLLGFVSDLAKHLDVKEINSRPYHPQSQGKIERWNSTWKRKLKYDILKRNRKQYISSNFSQYVFRGNVNQVFIPLVYLNLKLLLFVCKLVHLDNFLTAFYFFWLSKKIFLPTSLLARLEAYLLI